MKKMAVAAVVGTGMVFAAWAATPILFHPPVPGITATKAIKLATKLAGVETNAARHCSSVILNE